MKGKYIMKDIKKNKKWIFIGVAIIIVASISGIAFFSGGVLVDIGVVENDKVAKLIKEVGTVESESAVTITAKNILDIKDINVSEGDEVTSGQLLIAIDEDSAEFEIKSLKAKLSGLQVEYSQAKNIANKNKTLYEQGALSYEEYNKSNTVAKQLSAEISSLNYSIESYIETSGTNGIVSPIDGVVTGVFVKEGENVSIGGQLIEISNLNDIYVKVDLITEDADLVKVGDKVSCYNEDTGFKDNNCTIKKIHLKAQEKISDLGVKQKRVAVEIGLSGDKVVRLGSNVDVDIIVDQKDKTLRVPDTAIFEMKNKDYVYVINGKNAELREVEIGIEGEDYTEIIKGLEVGEKVIISPNDEIEDGVKVKISEV